MSACFDSKFILLKLRFRIILKYYLIEEIMDEENYQNVEIKKEKDDSILISDEQALANNQDGIDNEIDDILGELKQNVKRKIDMAEKEAKECIDELFHTVDELKSLYSSEIKKRRETTNNLKKRALELSTSEQKSIQFNENIKLQLENKMDEVNEMKKDAKKSYQNCVENMNKQWNDLSQTWMSHYDQLEHEILQKKLPELEKKIEDNRKKVLADHKKKESEKLLKKIQAALRKE